jgi:hypothetical protein
VTISSDDSAPMISGSRAGGMKARLAFRVSPRRRSTAYQRSLSGIIPSTYWPGPSTVAFCAVGPPLTGSPFGMYSRSARVDSTRSSSRSDAASVASR